MKNLILLFPILLGATGAPAEAACPDLVKALKDKMSEYKSFRASNEESQSKLRSAADDCHARGAALSEKAVQAANGMSCTAQADAHSVDQEISALGASCKRIFSELDTLQEQLRAEFMESKGDLEEGIKELKAAPEVAQFCGDDLKVAETMAEAFVKLESSIVQVRDEATSGARDYSNLMISGQQLASATKARNDACGGKPGALPALSREGMLARGEGSGVRPVPAGPSDNTQSDITGTKKALDDAAVSAAAASQSR